MDPLDELFEQKMQEIESGKPIDEVILSLTPGTEELAGLLRSAVSARKAASPAINVNAVRRQKASVVAESKRRQARLPLWWAVAGGGVALLLIFFIAALSGGLLLSNRLQAQQVTLMDISGVVAVLPPGDNAEWDFVENGNIAKAGSLIRTYADSSVTLLYYDGTRSILDPGTELMLTDLGGGGSSLKVNLDQRSGTTHHSVVPLQGSVSFFYVNTPTGKVSVHGTLFNVNVVPGAGSLYTVDRGQIEVSNQTGKMMLTAGQGLSLTSEDETPGDPGYTFMLRGKLTEQSPTHWVVEGVGFDVNAQTVILGSPVMNDLVWVRGLVSGGVFTASRIEPAKNDNLKTVFTGIVGSIGADVWEVGGISLKVDGSTEIGDGILVNDVVEVRFTVLEDDTWLAKEIEPLIEDEIEPTATVESTLTPSGSETVTPTVTPTPEGTTTPETMDYCTGNTDHHPEGIKLAERYGVAYDEIMGWFCQHYGFGEIDMAYSLSLESGLPVDQIFAMRAEGMGWGKIKQELSPKATTTPRPERVKPTKKPRNP